MTRSQKLAQELEWMLLDANCALQALRTEDPSLNLSNVNANMVRLIDEVQSIMGFLAEQNRRAA